MRISDKIDPQSLERREFQLSVFSIVVIAVMAIGMAASVYPMVFSQPVTPETETARKSFYAFCVLSVLMVSYLINRQIIIRKLRKQITEGQNRIEVIRREASADLLSTLSGLSHFQDRLTMEFRRCASTGDRLSLLLVQVKLDGEILDAGEIDNAYGDATRALMVNMRKEDSIFGFHPGGFGIIVLGSEAAPAAKVCNRLVQSLEEARRKGREFSFESRIVKYPEDARTAWEMEQALRSFLSVDDPAKPVPNLASVRL